MARADSSLIDTAQEWQGSQRAKILGLFQEQVYGRPTVGRPEGMSFEVLEVDAQAMAGAATLKRIAIAIPNQNGSATLTIRVVLFLPNSLQAPAPTFLLINNRPESNTDPTRATKSEFWPAETVIGRGFGVAAFHIDDLDPDEDSFDNGVHQLFDGGVRGEATWGALAAWAWGASRVLDYFETDTGVNAERVAVIGHSRGGKAALVAGATDERFALTISNDSGEGGAALARRNVGESIQAINTTFPHWFALNYRGYNGAPEKLPIDQHELIALMAPRAVYVASASDDAWADPEGEFLSAINAAQVFSLFGLAGLGAAEFPAVGEHIHGQQMGYHLRPGVHDLTQFDWDRYMDFFETVQITSNDPGEGGAGGMGALPGDAGGPAGGSAPSGQAGGGMASGTPDPVANAGSAGSLGQSPLGVAPSNASSGGGCACRAATGRTASRVVGSWWLLGLGFVALRRKRRLAR